MTQSDTSDTTCSPNIAQLAWHMPWKARNELERLLLLPFAWLSLRGTGLDIGVGWHCYGLPILQKHRQSTLKIGARCHLRSNRRSNPLGLSHPCMLSTRSAAAHLSIGDDFGMTGGAIVCETEIILGHRIFMGANSVITDTDFHPLDPIIRNQSPAAGATAPIHIGDDVFIGMRTMILKGVTIGEKSVIGAGSIVTTDIPAGVIAAGNPAKIIRKITQ